MNGGREVEIERLGEADLDRTRKVFTIQFKFQVILKYLTSPIVTVGLSNVQQ